VIATIRVSSAAQSAAADEAQAEAGAEG